MAKQQVPGTDATMEYVFITPEIARQYIEEAEANPLYTNRTFNKERAISYGADMARGKPYWNLTHQQSIAFGKKTALLDGQHRLHAIIQAAAINPEFKGLQMLVYRNLDDDVRLHSDIGRLRSVGDMLRIDGKQNGGTMGSATNLVINYLKNERIGSRHSTPEKLAFIDQNPDIVGWAEIASHAVRVARPSALCAVTFLGTRASGMIDTAKRFADGVIDGAGLDIGDPRLALRDSYMSARGTRGESTRADWALQITANAWNAFVTQREIHNMRGSRAQTGEFVIPDIHGAPVKGAGLTGVNDAVLTATVKKVHDKYLAGLKEFSGERGEAVGAK